MSWTPRYSAVFEEPIIRNVLAIIERDMKAALDHWYPDDNLKDFVERSVGTERGVEFPMLVIGPRSNLIETDADLVSLIEPQIIEMKLATVDNNPADAYFRTMKYVRALDSVLRSAAKADYTANMTSSTPFALIIDVTHEYLPLGVNDTRTSYVKPAGLELRLTFREL